MDECVVKISQGYLKGVKKTTVLNKKDYFSFQGIPYAEPPIGDRRFKDPEPAGEWSGVRDASQFGNVCPQFHELTHQIIGSEDCLYLNVYTSQIFASGVNLKPVMVWIHGGGFTFGNGSDEMYGPDFLVEKDIVLVTMNYRVGVFGFLNLGNSEVPGNAGLKDQSLALKWVSENAHHFGGDPKNVTLFGESAGAAAVHYHTLSALSKGLFHRVIMQSGCVLNPWAFFENAIPRAFKLADVLGQNIKDPKELLTFLREQPIESLVSNQGKILAKEEKTKLVFPFVPSKEIAGTGRNFIVEHPDTLLKNGHFADVPYMIGMNDKEGLIMLKEGLSTNKLSKLNDELIRFVPHDLCNSVDVISRVSSETKKFYMRDAPLSIETLSQYTDICTDLDFTIGINNTLRYLSKKVDAHVYVYLFTFEGHCGYLKSFIKTLSPHVPAGVCHADEIGYLFHNNFVNGSNFPLGPDSKEVKIINTFCSLWTNFATKSDPNGENVDVVWTKNNENNFRYLSFGEKLEMVDSKLVAERDDFWENIYASTRLANKL